MNDVVITVPANVGPAVEQQSKCPLAAFLAHQGTQKFENSCLHHLL